jgi:hypothetical protein
MSLSKEDLPFKKGERVRHQGEESKLNLKITVDLSFFVRHRHRPVTVFD